VASSTVRLKSLRHIDQDLVQVATSLFSMRGIIMCEIELDWE
jgi:hypothetical protein